MFSINVYSKKQKEAMSLTYKISTIKQALGYFLPTIFKISLEGTTVANYIQFHQEFKEQYQFNGINQSALYLLYSR